MKSIRLYLLLALLATVTLVNFVALLQGYTASITQAQAIFDQRLKSMVHLIFDAHEETREVYRAPTSGEIPLAFFQIWNAEGTVLIDRSKRAPATLLVELNNGFRDVNFDRYRWRLYAEYEQNSQRWVIAAERYDDRYKLAEQVALESVYPILVGIPAMAIIIWFAVGVGLKPLHKLTEQLENKQVDDLSNVAIHPVPNELQLLVQTVNKLLGRLDDAFQREQRFSADAAHELRTPISILKVHLHNLKAEIGSNNTELSAMQIGLDRLGNSIEQILVLYRTSPDKAATKFEHIDVHLMAQNVIAEIYEQFEQKQQTISLTGELAMINASAFALETLMKNLLLNANKYTPEQGEIRVDVSETQQSIRFTVEDSGMGIPETAYDRIFERFYRLGGDRHSSGVTGSGLGLAIVKHIVDLHEATIMLSQSQFETGLKVIIDFKKSE